MCYAAVHIKSSYILHTISTIYVIKLVLCEFSLSDNEVSCVVDVPSF